MRYKVLQSYHLTVMKVRQSDKKYVSDCRKVTSMVKPSLSVDRVKFAPTKRVGAGPVTALLSKVTEAQHGLKGKRGRGVVVDNSV